MTKRIKHFIEFLFVLAFDAFFQCMPYRWAVNLGENIGVLFSHVLTKRNLLIMANLTKAFPRKRPEEIRKITLGVWRNIGRTAIEFIRFRDLNTGRTRDRFVAEGDDNLKAAMKAGKGIIFVTFHFTNWEINGVKTAEKVGQIYAIARPMKNPFVENWIQRKRGSNNLKMMLHRNAAKACLKALKEGAHVGILVDQNLYTGGIFVNFFGRPAATTTLPALLHHKTKSPVVIAYSLREGMKFRMVYSKPLYFPPVADRYEAIRAHTQIINDELEAIIRKTPENWFWIHNRWKRQPDKKFVS